jgi:hypothetical protein
VFLNDAQAKFGDKIEFDEWDIISDFKIYDTVIYLVSPVRNIIERRFLSNPKEIQDTLGAADLNISPFYPEKIHLIHDTFMSI